MLGNVWAELIKSEISLICSKSFIEQSDFSLSQAIFHCHFSFQTNCCLKIRVVANNRLRELSWLFVENSLPLRIRYFSSKSQEKSRISAKCVCITFAQYCSFIKNVLQFSAESIIFQQICPENLPKISGAYRSFFSKIGLKKSSEIPEKSAASYTNLSLKILSLFWLAESVDCFFRNQCLWFYLESGTETVEDTPWKKKPVSLNMQLFQSPVFTFRPSLPFSMLYM